MKGYFAAIVVLGITACDATKPASPVLGFGPRECVSISKSSTGTCVLSLDCEDLVGANVQALAETEFAFNCVGNGVVRHSFGHGGFEPNEEFDTNVKCDRCDVATPMHLVQTAKPMESMKHASKAPVAPLAMPAHTAPVQPVSFKIQQKHAAKQTVKKADSKAHSASGSKWFFGSKKQASPEKVNYGPQGCVSVWKNKDGHCIMATDCAQHDIETYEFGLVCVDKVGSPVKHLFGKNSFDAKETFDTLIKCDQCLGLENVPDEVTLAGEVAVMQKDLAGLKDVMKNISVNVQMLNNEVFSKEAASTAAAPAPAAAVPAAPAAAKALVHTGSHHHRHHLRHHKRHHHHTPHHGHHHRAQEYYNDQQDAAYTESGRYNVEERAAEMMKGSNERSDFD